MPIFSAIMVFTENIFFNRCCVINVRKRNRIRYVNKISHVFTRKHLELT